MFKYHVNSVSIIASHVMYAK